MDRRIPLAEQLDEIANEYTRRCRAYPILVARGEMRANTAEFKIERLAAVHNTMAWLFRHADEIKEWMLYMRNVLPPEDHAAFGFGAPIEVEITEAPEIADDADSEESLTRLHADAKSSI